jgi:uncharacterized protein
VSARVRSAVFAFATLFALAAPAFALDLPAKPTGHVNDYASALSAGERAELEAQLTAYGQGTTRQYAVAIFKSLDGQDIADFSIRLADAWSLRGKKSGDGVLLTVFVDDHKLRIEVGYALEDKLTDAYCAELIRDTIAPAFRRGAVAGGIAAAFEAIDFQVTGEHRAVAGARRPSPRTSYDDGSHDAKLVGLALFVVFILVLVLLAGRGGRGGGAASNVLSFMAGMMLGGRGWSSGGGGSSGGGSSGGGFGGFGGGGGGGFGGSGFGGGGASGDW